MAHPPAAHRSAKRMASVPPAENPPIARGSAAAQNACSASVIVASSCVTSHVPPASGPGPAAVLDAALGLGLIDATSRAILGSVYAEGLTSAQAAGRHGTTATAVRWRCSRDVRRLAARSLDLWLVAA